MTDLLVNETENYRSVRTAEQEVDDQTLREATRAALIGNDDQWIAFVRLLPLIGIIAEKEYGS